jgi:protein-disulfide isomerase
MTKQFWAILAVIAVILGGIFVLSNNKKAAAPGNTPNASAVTKHIEGKGLSGVTLKEYGDFQCPACGVFFPVVQQVVAKYNDQIYFQFSNLPLTQLHPNSFAAARTAEAAGLQGKYFEMHALLYQNQSAWSQSTNAETIFTSMAQQLGLNMTKFKQDYSSTAVNNAINADTASFKSTGAAMATPTYFLDGKIINNTDLFDSTTGGPSVEKFSKLIDAAIAAKKQ